MTTGPHGEARRSSDAKLRAIMARQAARAVQETARHNRMFWDWFSRFGLFLFGWGMGWLMAYAVVHDKENEVHWVHIVGLTIAASMLCGPMVYERIAGRALSRIEGKESEARVEVESRQTITERRVTGPDGGDFEPSP